MNTYIRSKRTKQDIQQITRRSVEDFGETQTLKYMADLQAKMQLPAERPDVGRDFVHSRTRRQYLFFRHESHVIYYRKRICDVLHCPHSAYQDAA